MTDYNDPEIDARVPSVSMKVLRAKRHLRSVNSIVDAYLAREPIEVQTIGDPLNGIGEYKVSNIRVEIPFELALVVGDMTHNLRTALDHLAYAAVPQPHTTDVSFPIVRKGKPPRSRAEWRGPVLSKVKGASKSFVDAMLDLEPWEGGKDEWLWALDRLDIIDKHRLLLTVAARYAFAWNYAQYMINHFPDQDWVRKQLEGQDIRVYLTEQDWEPISVGSVLFASNDPGGFKANVDFRFNVALAEPAIMRKKYLGEALDELVKNVEALVGTLADKL